MSGNNLNKESYLLDLLHEKVNETKTQKQCKEKYPTPESPRIKTLNK